QSRASDRALPDFFASQSKESKVIPIVSLSVDSSLLAPKPIPEVYTGFKIEVMRTEGALPLNHDLFFLHGRVSFEELEDGQFAYTLGDFKTREQADKFREEA
ncbi:hypothetical protein RZS08_64870, partial [Arthrospira platensis SPKY1]|nr:hypothetical protein [Arthrospira platensis SPKY1]